MRLCVISCEVFCREFAEMAAGSPHVVDLSFQPFGLHDTPEALRENLQKAIDNVPVGRYDAILIGYGLCCRGTAQIVARHTPLVLVRAHDCITFFLGSKERYMKQFTESPGTYYYSPGWIERKDGTAEQGFVKFTRSEERAARFETYVQKYGEDNARYLIDLESHWQDNYQRATFINQDIGQTPVYQAFVEGVATEQGWAYSELKGDPRLLTALFDGNWNSEDFLVVPVGSRVIETHDEHIIATEVCETP